MSINISKFQVGDVFIMDNRTMWVVDIHEQGIIDGLVVADFDSRNSVKFIPAFSDKSTETVIATPQQIEFICNMLESYPQGYLPRVRNACSSIYTKWRSEVNLDFTLCDTLMDRLYTGNIIHLDFKGGIGDFVVISTPQDPQERCWSTYHLLSLEDGNINRNSRPLMYFPDGDDHIESTFIPGSNVLNYFEAMLSTHETILKTSLRPELSSVADIEKPLVDFYKAVVARVKKNNLQ